MWKVSCMWSPGEGISELLVCGLRDLRAEPGLGRETSVQSLFCGSGVNWTLMRGFVCVCVCV